MTAPSRLTAAQRAEWVARARAIPQTVERLLQVVAGLNEGQTYTVETFKNNRRSTITGSFRSRSGDELVLDVGDRHRVIDITTITRITTGKEN